MRNIWEMSDNKMWGAGFAGAPAYTINMQNGRKSV